jgi:hypothetical protein
MRATVAIVIASEGRGRAKARGVKLGRKPKLTPHQKDEAIRRRRSIVTFLLRDPRILPAFENDGYAVFP